MSENARIDIERAKIKHRSSNFSNIFFQIKNLFIVI